MEHEWTRREYCRIMSPLIMLGIALVFIFCGLVLLCEGGMVRNSSRAICAGAVSGAIGAVFFYGALFAVEAMDSVDEVIAHATERPGVMHDIEIGRWAMPDVAVSPSVAEELLPRGGPTCRTVKDVMICRDAENDRLLLHFDEKAEDSAVVERISTQEDLIAAVMHAGGFVEIPIESAQRRGAPGAVSESALVELYGESWRTEPACRIVEKVAACRRDDDSTLVLMAESGDSADDRRP